MPRQPQLADRENVEREIEIQGYLIGDGNAAPWQGQNNHVGGIRVLAKLLRQQSSSIAPVAKDTTMAPDATRDLRTVHRSFSAA